MADKKLIPITDSYRLEQPLGYATQIVYSSIESVPLFMIGYSYTSMASSAFKINDESYRRFYFHTSDSWMEVNLQQSHRSVLRLRSCKIAGTDLSNISWRYEDPKLEAVEGDKFVFGQKKNIIYIKLDKIKDILKEELERKAHQQYSYRNLTLEDVLFSRDNMSEFIPVFKTIPEIKDKIYEAIKQRSKTPFIKEWMDFILEHTYAVSFYMSRAIYADIDDPNNVYAFLVEIDEYRLSREISLALSQGLLKINGSNMVSSTFSQIETLTDYLKFFSGKLIDKASNCFNPIFDPNTEKFTQKEKDYFDYAAYSGKLKFFNAQKNVIGAISRSLNVNKSALLVGEMGCGKTALGIASTYVNSKKRNPTNIVMCPGHLVEKWKREIERLYPGAKAVIVEDFDTLLKMDKEITNKKRDYPLFMVISKDVSKINYVTRPNIIYDKIRHTFVCPHCGCEFTPINVFHSCNNGTTIVNTYDYHRNHVTDRRYYASEKYPKYGKIDLWKTFLTQTRNNSTCCSIHNSPISKRVIKKNSKGNRIYLGGSSSIYSCGCQLWSATTSQEESDWKKYAGAGYIHKDMVEDIKALYNNKPSFNAMPEANRSLVKKLYKAIINDEEVGNKKVAPRRYSIAKYIHKKYKNMIDYFIADEVHMYSSSSSAQANAFGDFVLTAKKTIALTGTLLNGYADGIYYILYRMYPKAFQRYGYSYNTVAPFIANFGVQQIVTKFTIRNGYQAQTSKTTKTCPGVSPKLFTQFLLDKAIFISLSDMSTGLPKYNEIPVSIRMDNATRERYNQIVSSVRNYFSNERNQGRRMAIAFAAAQKMSLYPDQPYNVSPIVNPDDYSKTIISFPDAVEQDNIKNFYSQKDIRILELTREKIAKGENVLIYLDYVNKTDCIERLERMFKEAEIKTCVLTSSIAAKDREEWIDNKVREGCRVMICNPRLVETGLDLLSFTNIIFYQVGYNLFTMRQASRRSLRLNQPNNVNVYFMYFEHTAQETVLSLMANKLQAAMAIEGKFSEEGLTAMSNNDNILTRLASSLIEDIEYKIEEGDFKSAYTAEEDDGSRFKMVYILDKEDKKICRSIYFREYSKGDKKVIFSPKIQRVEVV